MPIILEHGYRKLRKGMAPLKCLAYSDTKVGKIKPRLSQFISQNTNPRPNATGRLHEAPDLDGSNLAGLALSPLT